MQRKLLHLRRFILFACCGFMPAHVYAQTTLSGTSAAEIRSYNLNDLEGVATQLENTDVAVPAASVAADMQTIGIWNYRDGIPTGSYPSSMDQRLEAVSCPSGKLVNHATLLVSSPSSVGDANLNANGTWPLTSRLAKAESLNTSPCAGMVTALEGPNEINNFPIQYGSYGSGCTAYFWGGGPASACSGSDELTAAETAQQAIYAYAHNHMTNVAVDYFTGYGGNMSYNGSAIPAGLNPATASGYADYDNAHPYPQNGSPPYWWTNRDAANWAMRNEDNGYTSPAYMTGAQPPSATQPVVTPVKQPAVTTEGGYVIGTSNLCAYNYNSNVNADIAGKQTVMDWLDGVLQGYTHVFIYKLINDDKSGFGFFDSSNRETLQGTYTGGMNQIIKDTASTAKTFPLYGVSWTATARPTSGMYAETIELANGNYFVAVWQEAQICSNSAHKQVAAPTLPVTFKAGGTVAKIAVYDPTSSKPLTPVTQANASSLTFNVTDHPVFFEVYK